MSESQTKAGNQKKIENLKICSKVAVYSRKLQCFFYINVFFDKTFHLCFFWDHITTLSTDIRVHRAGSQLKIIALNIFNRYY